jgi:hypothetical protein
MLPEIISQLPSLGIAGLLFVMWWVERQERAGSTAGLREALHHAGQSAEINQNLLDVIRANTEALTALREELRAHRATETQWVTRLTEQLEELGCQ